MASFMDEIKSMVFGTIKGTLLPEGFQASSSRPNDKSVKIKPLELPGLVSCSRAMEFWYAGLCKSV